MTLEDRELLEALQRRQAELARSLALIDDELANIERRAEAVEPVLPSLPTEPITPPISVDQHPPLPAIPATPPPPPAEAALPPLPAQPPESPLPPIPRPSLEFQFGRWLTRIGAVFGIITLVLILSLTHNYLFRVLGPGGILGLCALASIGIAIWGDRIERRLLVFGRSILSLGLAGLYVTLYAAHNFDSVRVIQSPLVAGVLLLLWSFYVLTIADRKRSQSLALFSIALAYFSTAINPDGRFSMAADLLLAGTVMLFLIRHGWAALSYLSLFGTYAALLRRLVMDQNGELVLDTSRALPFAPYAVYLVGAWVIFTAAVLMTKFRSFRGQKRLVFLTLNNGALAVLLPLAAYIAGYGDKAMSETLLWTGLAFLLLAWGGKLDWRRSDAPEMRDAYLAQGLAIFTLGLMGVYAGATRGVLLAVETLFLGMAGIYARGVVMKIAAWVTAFFATLFLAWDISVTGHHSWLLGFGGAGVMLINAWWARNYTRMSPLARQGIIPSASYYCALAIALIVAAMAAELSDSALPPALAVAAVVLTFSIYFAPLYELPPIAQALLIAAQALVLFPAQTGEAVPRSTTAWVVVLTLLLLAWWSRQRVARYGVWIVLLNFIYALALVGLCYDAVRPYVDNQGWMISASLLSGGFLLFGALTRVWPLAAMGQLFLLASLWLFFFPVGGAVFPYTWIAAAVPIAIVFATGHATIAWLREFREETPESISLPFRLLGHGYLLLALGMLVRLVFAVAPQPLQTATFLFLGSLLLAWSAVRDHAFGARCSFVLSLIGMALVVRDFDLDQRSLVTFLNGLALFALLWQPTVLQHAARKLVTEVESWILILLSAAAGWIFVHAWVATRMHPNYLTMGWALYALYLFFFGLAVRERRQRWCGLGILACAMIRVCFSDIWGFSNGYKVLTFIVLTFISLGLGYLYARFADRFKSWL
jgi:hypothetical protein